MTVVVTGMSAVRRALLMVGQEGAKTTSREVVRSALNIQRGAKEEAPVGTPESTGIPGYRGGRLRNSIAVAETEAQLPTTEGTAVAPNAIRPGMLSAVIGTNVIYAPHVHFGTIRMRARPFLFNAWEAERPKFIQRMQQQLGEAFVKIRG